MANVPERILRHGIFLALHFSVSLGGFYYVANTVYHEEIARFSAPPLFFLVEAVVLLFLLPLVYPVIALSDLIARSDSLWILIIGLFLGNSALVVIVSSVIVSKIRGLTARKKSGRKRLY
jgi:hypothetical protein